MTMTEEDLGAHITKGEVVDVLNHMGSEWNKALGIVYDRVTQLEGRLQMSDTENETPGEGKPSETSDKGQTGDAASDTSAPTETSTTEAQHD
jgi:hypothetical protein